MNKITFRKLECYFLNIPKHVNLYIPPAVFLPSVTGSVVDGWVMGMFSVWTEREKIRLKSCELTFKINNVQCKLTSHSKSHVSKESNALEGHNSPKGTLNWHLKVIMKNTLKQLFYYFFKLLMPPQGLNKGLSKGIFIIHSKIFPFFWLVKTTHIIHHHQLLLTKFGNNFVIMKRWHQNAVKSAAWLQVIEPVTKKTWGWGWVVLVVGTKWRNCRGTFYLFHGKILSKNIAEQC